METIKIEITTDQIDEIVDYLNRSASPGHPIVSRDLASDVVKAQKAFIQREAIELVAHWLETLVACYARDYNNLKEG